MSSTDPVKVSLHVEWPTGNETTVDEIDRAEWEAMTPQERSQTLDEIAEAFATNRVGWGWHIDDPDDMAATK